MKFRKWSIWKANLDPVIGSEQGKTRPVLIISEDVINNILPVINVLPLTSRKLNRKVYPNEAIIKAGTFGLANESLALCYQIRTLDKKRLVSKYGDVNEIPKQQEILEALCFQLGIDRAK